MANENEAFRAGFVWGVQGEVQGYELSCREVADLHPEYSAGEDDAFMQGMLDGLRGDRYRYELLSRGRED